MFDKQKIFTASYEGMRSQNFERSITVGGISCRYRDGHGKRCAIGWCIPDDAWECVWENLSIESNVVLRKRLGWDDPTWLQELQSCHDNADGADAVQANMHDFAHKHNLEIPK
jgi:hypothetical protein